MLRRVGGIEIVASRAGRLLRRAAPFAAFAALPLLVWLGREPAPLPARPVSLGLDAHAALERLAAVDGEFAGQTWRDPQPLLDGARLYALEFAGTRTARAETNAAALVTSLALGAISNTDCSRVSDAIETTRDLLRVAAPDAPAAAREAAAARMGRHLTEDEGRPDAPLNLTVGNVALSGHREGECGFEIEARPVSS
jgi:hypothetical protein